MQHARHSDLVEQTNRVGVDFLFADLELAFTFLHVGETSTSAESRGRNYANAIEGYRAVVHFLPRVVPSPEQRAKLQDRLDELKNRLHEAGYSVES